jgi:hypothetical protein
MRYLWLTVNIAVVLSSPWVGYKELAPERLAHENTDQLACLAVAVVMPLFVLGALWFATTRVESFRRPAWDRFPINWWYDPLQALFITTLCSFGWAVGSQFRFPVYGTVAYWTVILHWCIFGGLVLGEFIAYPIFHHRVEEA